MIQYASLWPQLTELVLIAGHTDEDLTLPDLFPAFPALTDLHLYYLTHISANLGTAQPPPEAYPTVDPLTHQRSYTPLSQFDYHAPEGGITSLPTSFKALTCLTSLTIESTNISTLPDMFTPHSPLTHLQLNSNYHLHLLPDSLGHCSHLSELLIYSCPISELPFFDSPVYMVRLRLPGAIGMLPRGMFISDNIRIKDLDNLYMHDSFYGYSGEALWECKFGDHSHDLNWDRDPEIQALLRKYAKHVSELAEIVAAQPTDPTILTLEEWERLESEGGPRELALLAPIFPPNHPVLVAIHQSMTIPSLPTKDIPFASIYGQRNLCQLSKLAPSDYLRHIDLRHTDLHPHALDLLSAIPQDHTHLSSFYAEHAIAEQAIATYYAKYPTTLARELAQNPATALTENELERLKWEGGRGELFILSSTTPHPRIQEVIQTITDRLERSPKNEDPPILL